MMEPLKLRYSLQRADLWTACAKENNPPMKKWHWLNRKIAGRWLNRIINYRRSARLRPYISASVVAHEVLPCLTLAFETIDKVRLKNSLAEYVTHFPRMINLSGARSRKRRHLRRNRTWTNRRGETCRAFSLGVIAERIRGKVNATRANVREKPAPVVPLRETRLKLRLKFNLSTIPFRERQEAIKIKSLRMDRLHLRFFRFRT